MINIAELLKDAPKDMKLYSPLFGEVKFKYVNDNQFGIVVEDSAECHRSFDKYGRYFTIYNNAECLLFPSKDCRTWEEWKLSVEPKFKVRDWVVRKDGRPFCGGNYAEQITSIEDDEKGKYIYLSSTSWIRDNAIRLWTIEDAKDGDVLAANECYVIFKEIDGLNIKCYCTYHYMGFNPSFHIDTLQNKTAFHPATKEQREVLFDKMKGAGYQWDEKKKELRKIQPHYDIANFKPFDKVLVRYRNREKWQCAWFSSYNKELPYSFITTGADYKQCIPFEGNEHLLGTTDMPDECYINW